MKHSLKLDEKGNYEIKFNDKKESQETLLNRVVTHLCVL